MKGHDVLTTVLQVGGGGLIGSIVTGVVSVLTSGKSAPAETQEQINEGFKAFMAESRQEVEELKKDNRGLRQYVNLLVGILQSQNITVPPMSVVVEDYIILPPGGPEL